MANQTNMVFSASNGEYVVGLTGTQAPSDAEWDGYINCIRSMTKLTGGFAISLGAGPSAAQRAKLKAFPQLQSKPAVLITSSTFVRGIVTAITWVTRAQMRAFAPAQLNAALDFIALPAADRARFLEAVRTLGTAITPANPADLLSDE